MSNQHFTALGAGTYQITSPLTFDTVSDLFDLSTAWWSASAEMVQIDLKSVPKADSAGLALMVEWLEQARRAQRRLAFTNIPAKLQDLIRVSGLQDIFLNEKK
ncbi:MAG TPA: STAS domain-containing protein [Acidiferrobacterales bacterium]|nr:STAS domain-containing protein [Acidiferrobacterales bacterium]